MALSVRGSLYGRHPANTGQNKGGSHHAPKTPSGVDATMEL